MSNLFNKLQSPPHKALFVTTLSYLALIIYGTLYPFSDWQWQYPATSFRLLFTFPSYFSRADLVTNLLIFIPLGFLAAKLFANKFPLVNRVLIITAFGCMLSLSIEFLQTYLPSRNTSIVDALLNTSGTFIGVIVANFFHPKSNTHQQLLIFKQRWFQPSELTNVLLLIFGLWILSQLTPLIPSISISNLRHGLAPIKHWLAHPESLDINRTFVYSLNIFALGLMTIPMIYPVHRRKFTFLLCVGLVLLLKVPINTRQLSMEAILGWITAGLILSLTKVHQIATQFIAAICIISAYFVDSLAGVNSGFGLASNFNWIPFKGQMVNLHGLTDIVSTMWPFAALAYCVLALAPNRLRLSATLGAIVIAIATFAVEWNQRLMIGRYADITDVVLALMAWYATFYYFHVQKQRWESQSTPVGDNIPPQQ